MQQNSGLELHTLAIVVVWVFLGLSFFLFRVDSARSDEIRDGAVVGVENHPMFWYLPMTLSTIILALSYFAFMTALPQLARANVQERLPKNVDEKFLSVRMYREASEFQTSDLFPLASRLVFTLIGAVGSSLSSLTYYGLLLSGYSCPDY